jgi:hypothetical protein
MNNGEHVSSPGPDRRCTHETRRVIRLRLPLVEASMVRARLATETGVPVDVSPLSRVDGSWMFTMCRECAKRSALAMLILVVILTVP